MAFVVYTLSSFPGQSFGNSTAVAVPGEAENNENSCCPPYLRKELFLVVSQDFEPKKYVTENKFFSCSKSIPLLCVHRKPFFYFRCCADGFIAFLCSNNLMKQAVN